jgi:ribose-phosphate pyrophosphokinase
VSDARPLLFVLPGGEHLANDLAAALGAEVGRLALRAFPDGETYVRCDTSPADRDVVLLCSLHEPDRRLVPLLLVAATARDLGARRVGLVAPYLAYMRQDARFQPGEGISSRYVGRLLSGAIDWLVTVDPHLHRHRSLDEVYAVPATAVTAAPAIAAWLRREVRAPFLVGPDGESAQWVGAVADAAGAPHLVLEKVRHGDRAVAVSAPRLEGWHDRTPVLVDDIISTATTMAETVRQLRAAGMPPPICIGVHAVFAADAERVLRDAGAGRVVTCDTIAHATNAIDVAALLAPAVRAHLARATG